MQTDDHGRDQGRNHDPNPDTVQQLEPGLVRILAPNPSPMTFRGTNTYLIGTRGLAVIDPGPDDPAHLSAILNAVGRRPIEAILITHSHVDHSRLAPRMARTTGAPVLAFGDSAAGRSPEMQALAENGNIGGGEGVDSDFCPDATLHDGAVVSGTGWRLTALWTPGHFGNHMCFAWNGALFTGDHVMGWASSLISPPDGDLGQFMASCRRLLARRDRIFYPAHGAPVTAPRARLDELIAHREMRARQIAEILDQGPASAGELAARLYADTPAPLLPAATRNVLAHLIELVRQGRARCTQPLAPDSRFSPCDPETP